MLTPLDDILFPEDCEVVEMPLHNQWIYLIQKNGSSSLRAIQRHKKFRIFSNNELSQLECVDVYIRSPRIRYVSGVNTFLQYLQRDYPNLDQSTALWFVKKFSFLNRHYLPQFHWLLNLSRFINKNCKIRLRNFDDFKNYVSLDLPPAGVDRPSVELAKQLLTVTSDNETWFCVDQILQSLSGSEMTWEQIINFYKHQHQGIYDLMIKNSWVVKNVLSPA